MKKEIMENKIIWIVVGLVVLLVIAIVLYNRSSYADVNSSSYADVNSSSLVVKNSTDVSYESYESGIINIVGSDINSNLKIITYPTFKPGSIIIWSGSASTIPSGWILCDGSNGTPDLRGRFVVCAGKGGVDADGLSLTEKNVGAKGGKENVKLKKEEIPPHNHTYRYWEPNESGGNAGGGSYWAGGDVNSYTSDQGGDQAHNNMPPYYALCYIYYTGTSYKTLLNNDSGGNISFINYPSLPVGILMCWNGTTIPSGWSICDGSNNTPDLRGRFVVGIGKGGVDADGTPLTAKNLGDKGGEERHELTISEMPKHNHNFYDRNPTGARGQYGGSDNAPSQQADVTSNMGGNISRGKAESHENMPPYYALYYIYYNGGLQNNLLSSDLSGNITLINYPLFPVGMIMIWGGNISSIPSDWAICNGGVKKGYTTPNLQSRFVLGVGQGNSLTNRTLGENKGKERVVLDITEIPTHNHNYSRYYSFGSSGLYHCGWADSSCRGPRLIRTGITGSAGGNSDGKADSHENMPPYYALYYICYVGY